VATRFARLRRARDRQIQMVATRFARLRRARDRQIQMVATRFARLRRARDRHVGYAVQFQTDMSPRGYPVQTSVAFATTPLLLKKIFAQLPQCVAICS